MEIKLKEYYIKKKICLIILYFMENLKMEKNMKE